MVGLQASIARLIAAFKELACGVAPALKFLGRLNRRAAGDWQSSYRTFEAQRRIYASYANALGFAYNASVPLRFPWPTWVNTEARWNGY